MTQEKSQAELEIEALADVFGIATTGFNVFFKEADKHKSGHSSTVASSGSCSTAASSGDYSTAASSGYYSTAASSGDYSTAASSGDYSACTAVGYRAAVKGDKGNLLMASEYAKIDGFLIPIGGKADIVDGKKLKPNRWYIVENGKWVEIDLTDNIFSYVLSNRKGIKKVKTGSGKLLYIVSDEQGNSAHGETVEKARMDLVYKVAAKFDGTIPESATGKEWVGIYRAVTGACSARVRAFIETTGKSLDDTYTVDDVIKLAEGQFGIDKFREKVQRSA